MTEIFQVDAFADRAFTGNPAAVCPLDRSRDAAWMQSLAEEMNLSETAFLWPEAGGYRLRWFTPAAEVDLCGHATLASAHVLAELGELAEGESVTFFTGSGELRVVRRTADRYEMDFPALEHEPCAAPGGLVPALGLRDSDVVGIFRSRFDILVVVEREELVHGVLPDFARLKMVNARGIIVTAEASRPGADFVSRFFGPAVGVDEDPVTGSAHCCLAPYWSRRLQTQEMRAFQASARGGHVGLRVQGDRVFLSGGAVTIFRGELRVDSLQAKK